MAADSLPRLSSSPNSLTWGKEISTRAKMRLASVSFTAHSPKPLSSPWLGTKFSIKSSVSKLGPQSKRRPIVATVVSSLPTANPESAESAKNVPKWSCRAIKSFAMGELEARKLKYPTTGTEALLMGILIEGTSFTSKYLRENGITFFKVREESSKLLGKADLYFFSPEHPPLTEDAQRALGWAVSNKQKTDDEGEVTTTHMLLGIWSEMDSPGYKIMAALGFNEDNAKKLASLICEPGFMDK